MSIISSLKRLVDPIAVRREEQRREAERERSEAQTDGVPPRYACRICGRIGDEEAYCPVCLAPTMEPVRDAS